MKIKRYNCDDDHIVASLIRNIALTLTFHVNMAQFAKSTFSHASYATFRPSYPPSLYNTVLAYHHGPKKICVDLGCGHGVVARYLTQSFSNVIGTDPSDGMIEQAHSSTSQEDHPNLTFRKASAESLTFLEDESVDLVVAGQAAHWFDTTELFPEMGRILRKSGTLAFWGYTDHVFVDYPKATRILHDFAYGNNERLLGPYWSQPGRSKIENKLRDIEPPVDEWEEVQRIEYEPGTSGPKTGEGTMFLNRRMALGDCMNYVRTWSSYSTWQDTFQTKTRDEGGDGDVVDDMFDKMRAAEPDWQKDEAWIEKEVEIEWGSGLLFARRR